MSDAVRSSSLAARLALSRFRRSALADDTVAIGPRGRLFRKYVLLIVGLVSLVLLVNSALDFWFSYEEKKAALFRIQQEKAGSAARRIEQFVDEIERQLGWTTAPQWAASPLEQRRFDYVRLLRQAPAITELIQLDDTGKEQLKVSRLAIDVVGSEKDYSGSPSFIEARQHRVWFSPVYFRKESEPYMTVALARTGRNAGVTVAEVNLKLIWDVISGLKIGQGGYAYVVDREGRLIAHPDISLVLRNTDLATLPQVAAAHGEAPSVPSPAGGGGLGWGRPTDQAVMVAKGINGNSVLTAHAAIPPLGWTVFVELPLNEALAPLFGSMLRTAGLLALALVLATLAALLLARRMTVPIRELQAGAARIGAGELDRHIDIHTGDELEDLAGDFNRMAADLQRSYAGLEKKVEDRTAELKEALDQQTATAEVLGVINSSPGDLAPVFEAILEKAHSLCGAAYGSLSIAEGEAFRAVAVRGMPEAFADLIRRPFQPGPNHPVRKLIDGAPFAGVINSPEFDDPMIQSAQKLAGMRTGLFVPLRKENALVGYVVASRREVQPFSDKQIALLQNFAAQAVIAMENARLLTETREALEQQTATAEVLGIISSSPGHLAPVFDAMLANAIRVCAGKTGMLALFEGGGFKGVAEYGVGPEFTETLSRLHHPPPGTGLDRLQKTKRAIQVEDCAAEAAYGPVRAANPKFAEVRTALHVPMLKENELLGAILIYRDQVRAFKPKEIELVENFAKQAVIAIENTRLITETREALEQQTATAEVLGVINSSPGDLTPVFDAMLGKATTLCEAAFGTLWTYDGERFQAVALRQVPQAYADFLSQAPLRPVPFSGLGRVAAGESVAHFLDIAANEAYRGDDPGLHALLELGKARTTVAVSLRKDDAVLGAITAYRQEVRPFTDKQIALLQNFAAQAVIAMENARLITETREALEQQTATAEVLGVINSSPGDLAPVFDAMLKKAARLCGAHTGHLVRYENGALIRAASFGMPEEFDELLPLNAPMPDAMVRDSVPARMIAGRSIIHVPDLREDESYRVGAPAEVASVQAGIRTALFVPLIKDQEVVGAFITHRLEVRPFSDKQIALLQNFAAQAVIAMENARLITETREALEQQTATAEVLGVINSSPGELAPVFDAILEKAHMLCSAPQGGMFLREGDKFRAVTTRGMPEPFAERLRQGIGPDSPVPKPLIAGAPFVHIPDMAEVDHPMARLAVDVGAARSVLAVPLRKGDALFGIIVAGRREAAPFTDKQIALLQNFAAQAVIAMENARLITETREALEQQTATAEVLGVINSSPGDLAPVFKSILEKSARLCSAESGIFWVYKDHGFQPTAWHGVTKEFSRFLNERSNSNISASRFLDLIERGEAFTHTIDLAETHAATTNFLSRAVVDLEHARTGLLVPLRKDELLIGAIRLYRHEVRPFSDKQIALLQNFAAQAVIAMENARLITETREALEQQTATAEVLGVINSSPGDLAPVFEAMLEKAARLCEAPRGQLATFDGEFFRFVAVHGEPGFTEGQFAQGATRPEIGVTWPRIVRGERFVHMVDVMDSELYRAGHEGARRFVDVGGGRSLLTVALRKDEALLGALTIYRQEVRPFTDKQIALLENFAAQAVIAMENARLINETREALEQQTATAEVLQVINSSPGDLAPVFDAMLEKAMALCGIAHGSLQTYDGQQFRAVAVRGHPEPLAALLRQGYSLVPRHPMERLLEGDRFVQIPDLTRVAPEAGIAVRTAVEAGSRTLLCIPLRKDDALLGQIVAVRREVRPFSEKEIALLENFAAQAVIAMENARLITETREALDQQTATAEVLGVINSSPGDLAPVFDAMLEKATRLCEAAFGTLFTYDGECFHAVALRGVPAEFADALKSPVRPDPGASLDRIARGEPFAHFEDVANEAAFKGPAGIALVELGGARSALALPLRKDNALLGAFAIYRQEVRRFSDKQIALLQNFAAQAVIAIENTRLINELRARTEELGSSVAELKMLSEVGQAVSSTLDLRTVLSTILNASLGVTWANAGAVFRYSRAERAFRLVEAVGWDEALAHSVRELHVAETESAMGEAVARRMPIQLPDLAQRASYPLRDITLAAGFHSALIVPLVGAERILGAILLMRQEAGEFPAETVRLMQTLASQSVLAIQNARLFREIADKSEQLALASQHKSQFLANMSHELRTPLNAILGYAELLVDGIYGVLPDRPRGVLDRIQNNGKHLLALINDVLDLAKIEAGQLTLTLEDYSMPEVVQSVVTATEPLATSKGLKFTAALQDNLPMAHGDARRVAQVLLNLVGNAIKFADAGEVEIRAATDKGQFVLTVRDTGPGIADADQERIFGEFQQIDNSNTRKKGGTGLGLAISKRMVEMQGGTISVDSVLGQGSTFRVVLPVHVDEMMEEAA